MIIRKCSCYSYVGFFCKILIFPMIFFKSVSILVLSFSDIIINILKKFVRKRKMFLWNFKVVYCIFKIMSFWWTEFSINLDCIMLITWTVRQRKHVFIKFTNCNNNISVCSHGGIAQHILWPACLFDLLNGTW